MFEFKSEFGEAFSPLSLSSRKLLSLFPQKLAQSSMISMQEEPSSQ